MMHDSPGADQGWFSVQRQDVAKLAVSAAIERIARIGSCHDVEQIADARVLGAALMRKAAQAELLFEVTEARRLGRSWTQVAALVGVSDAYEAFAQVATAPRWSTTPRVEWGCLSCATQVDDFGPGIEDPCTRKRWHSDTCLRNHAEHAAYLAADDANTDPANTDAGDGDGNGS